MRGYQEFTQGCCCGGGRSGAAITFLRQVVAGTSVRPHRAATDKAAIYPPALRAVLPGTEHCTGKAEQQPIELDYQHLKGFFRPMRGCKRLPRAQAVCAAHAFVRNLRDGFYRSGIVPCTPRVRRLPRLMVARDEIIGLLQAA